MRKAKKKPLAGATGFRLPFFLQLPQLIIEQLMNADAGGRLDLWEVLNRDWLPLAPLGNSSLGDAYQIGQLLLTPCPFYCSVDCSHGRDISGADGRVSIAALIDLA